MTRPMSATWNATRSTFLLEVALDQARVRQRLAAALLRERGKRGRGDARKYPQPEMARLLNLSLRQYQRIEAGESMPRWRTLEQMADRLDITVADLIGDSDEAISEAAVPGEEWSRVFDRLDEILGRLDRLEERSPAVPASPAVPQRRRG